MKRKKREEPEDMNLNISSLMDVLTILLIFLIMNFDAEEQKAKEPKFELPDAKFDSQYKEVLRVSISTDSISVEDVAAVKLKKGKISAKDLNGEYIQPLVEQLKIQKNDLDKNAKTDAEQEKKDIIYIEADKELDYALVHKVMHSAANAGFTKFQLATHKIDP